jgi:hypothetical protein
MTAKEIWDYVNSLYLNRIKKDKFWGYININDEYVPEVIITSKDNYHTVIIPERYGEYGSGVGFLIRFTITKDFRLTSSTCNYSLGPVEILKKGPAGYERFFFISNGVYPNDTYCCIEISKNLLPLIRESKLKQIGI